MNYCGPGFLKSICDRYEIAMFDRVVEIQVDGIDPEMAGLNSEFLASFRHLSEFKVVGIRGSTELVAKAVPKCRITDLKSHEGAMAFQKGTVAQVKFVSCE